MDVSSGYRAITWTVDRFADSLLREMEAHRKAVGLRLLELRKSHGMTQEDAAHAVGVAVKTWSNWERGATVPYESNWRKIGETFEIDPGELIGTPPAPLGLGAEPFVAPDQAGALTEFVTEVREHHEWVRNRMATRGLDLSRIADRLSTLEAKVETVLENQNVMIALGDEVRELLRAVVPSDDELAQRSIEATGRAVQETQQSPSAGRGKGATKRTSAVDR